MYKFCGSKRKSGSFTNKDSGEVINYDNVEIYLLSDEDEDVVGLKPIVAAAKFQQLQLIGAKSLEDLIDKCVLPVADLDQKADENGRYKLLIKALVVM